MAKKPELRRIFKMDFCGGFVGVYKVTPRPKNEGEFLLAFRGKEERRILELLCGITSGGARFLIDAFKRHQYDHEQLARLISHKLDQRQIEGQRHSRLAS